MRARYLLHAELGRKR